VTDPRQALPRERISAAIRSAAASGNPALVAFLTAGYPSRERFREHLAAVAQGADVVEIGVPFTDPMADGMTIQRSSHEALRQGVSLR
jgi:tryptophan synthase alpha chain